MPVAAVVHTITSLACRPSVCDCSPSPMTRFQREISASTRARQSYPGPLPAPATAFGDALQMPVALRRCALCGFARHRIRARRHDHGRGGMAGRDLGIDIVAVVGTIAGEGGRCPIDLVEQGTDLEPSSASLSVSAEATIRPVSASVARCSTL